MTEALMNIQSRLNAPKNLYNSFGNYSYRSCESILEAVKPLLLEYGATLILTDEIKMLGDRFYVEATATFTCGDDEVVVKASAREADSKKGMDASQLTGTASSYARKYALNGLFLIDDAKDADTDGYRRQQDYEEPRPEDPKIGAKDMEMLTKYADEVGVSLDAICETFRVGSVQDLTMRMYVKAIKMLENTERQNKERNA